MFLPQFLARIVVQNEWDDESTQDKHKMEGVRQNIASKGIEWIHIKSLR